MATSRLLRQRFTIERHDVTTRASSACCTSWSVLRQHTVQNRFGNYLVPKTQPRNCTKNAHKFDHKTSLDVPCSRNYPIAIISRPYLHIRRSSDAIVLVHFLVPPLHNYLCLFLPRVVVLFLVWPSTVWLRMPLTDSQWSLRMESHTTHLLSLNKTSLWRHTARVSYLSLPRRSLSPILPLIIIMPHLLWFLETIRSQFWVGVGLNLKVIFWVTCKQMWIDKELYTSQLQQTRRFYL